MDSGELATVQTTLGIAHPTGYPLFTMLGFLWTKVPLNFSPVYMTNLLAAIFCASSIIFFYKSILLLLKKTSQSSHLLTIAVVVALTLAFSKTFWTQGVGVEVYALHLFLISIAFYLTIKAYYKSGKDLQSWLFVGIAFGFCFSNHMTSLVLVPGLLFLFFRKKGVNPNAFKIGALAAIIGLIILAFNYSYLYFRANQETVFNWGDPSTWNTFFDHISGKQYQDFFFKSLDISLQNLKYFILCLPEEFTTLGVLFFLLGLKPLAQKNPLIFNFLLVNIASNLLFAINYDIPDLDAYFLFAFFNIAIFIAFGIEWTIKLFPEFLSKPFSVSVLYVLPFLVAWYSISIVNLNSKTIPPDHAQKALQSLPENAVVFTEEWETFGSSALYFQLVEKLRPDVVLIETRLINNSPWYPDHLIKTYPFIAQHFEKELLQFKALLEGFYEEKIDRAALSVAYHALIRKMVLESVKRQAVYIGVYAYQETFQSGNFSLIKEPHAIIPQPFFYRFSLNKDYYPLESPINLVGMPSGQKDKFTQLMQREGDVPIEFYRDLHYVPNKIRYERTLLAYHRIQYELNHGKQQEAKQIFKIIQKEHPQFELEPSIQQAIEE